MYKMIQMSSRRVCITSALAALLLANAPVNYAMAYGGVTGIQQTASVNGVVVDQTGEAIIGATIKVKGSQKGAISDYDGNFTIDAQRGDELEISYIGYKTQVIKVSGQHVKVTLLEDSKALQEVVVVGFGTQKKVNLTGAVSVVDGDELAQRPVANAAQALQGVVPGLQIASTSGSLDASPSINVRGTATIGEGSSGSPLILIDGMEGDLNTINPQDIQSISVLKDAAASSIYGSRAPFGVILITTKNGGKDSKVKVNYNNSFRFSNLIRGKHMMNSVDYASWLNDAKTNQGQSVFFDAERMAAIKEYHEATPVGPGTRRTADGKLVYAIGSQNGVTWDDGYGYGIDDVDWYDVVYKNSAFSQEHNASVNGGTDKLNFYASIGYLDQGGFMNMGSDGFKRYNGTAKMNIELAKWIRMNYNMRFARTNYHRPAALTSSLYNDMARQGWPMLPLYDRNGYLYSSPSPALALATGGTDRKERDVLNHQLGFVIEPVKNWITHIDFNYKIDNAIRHWDSQRTYNHNVAGEAIIYNQGSNVHEDEAKDNYLNFQAYTEYTWSLAEKHNFHVMGGFQTEQLKRLDFGLQRDGILDPSKPEVDLTVQSQCRA